MEKRTRGISFYVLLFIMAIILYMIWKGTLTQKADYISHSEFEAYLEGNDIAAISIAQNSEVPTGIVQITLRNGTYKQMYASDVNEVEKELRDKFPSYT
ncbi:MAG: ATP-dependent metallopeptidase FtsH/Yme1/Tma family protein, partial [Lachnospiraceae bacterium]|nr:ATP-dependent metallopeptidase FtsH/Yme1/Tma family protein [Lachnospiraceae bacterium]